MEEQEITFEEKVRSMTGKEIVMAIVNGLKKEHVRIDMMSFGHYDILRNVCFGCAATNTICEISNKSFDNGNIQTTRLRAAFLSCDIKFLRGFEDAIEDLRCGGIEEYNEKAKILDIAILPIPAVGLPGLHTYDYQENLHYYESYANTL